MNICWVNVLSMMENRVWNLLKTEYGIFQKQSMESFKNRLWNVSKTNAMQTENVKLFCMYATADSVMQIQCTLWVTKY